MKIKVLKGYKRFLAFMLSVIGIGISGCDKKADIDDLPLMYGTPSATYQVSGFVYNEQQQPIGSIGIIASGDTSYNYYIDTSYSNSVGYYSVYCYLLRGDTAIVSFMDSKGVYQKLDTAISFANVPLAGGDGNWNLGTKSKVLNVTLKKK